MFAGVDADTRSAKVFSRQSYEKGIVIVQCAGCQGRHLIADRLGWFGDPTFTLDQFLEQRGEGKLCGVSTVVAATSSTAVCVGSPTWTCMWQAAYRAPSLLSLDTFGCIVMSWYATVLFVHCMLLCFALCLGIGPWCAASTVCFAHWCLASAPVHGWKLCTDMRPYAWLAS